MYKILEEAINLEAKNVDVALKELEEGKDV
jgi:hypothetical protein